MDGKRVASVLSMVVVTACGGGGGSAVLGDVVVQSVDGDVIDELDASTQDSVDVVLEVSTDGDAGSVTPDLTADVLVEGVDVSGTFDRFDFSVVEQDEDGFRVVLRVGPLYGASDITALAESLEEAGIDPADAGATLVEDRGDDGVLEVEVRIRGDIETTGGGDVAVDEDVTFDVVESGDEPEEADATTTTAGDEPDDEVDTSGLPTASVDDDVVSFEFGGTSVTGERPGDWSDATASGGFVSYRVGDGGTGTLTMGELFRPDFEAQAATELSSRLSIFDTDAIEETEGTVDGQDSVTAVAEDEFTAAVVVVIDLGDAVLTLDLYTTPEELDAGRDSIDAFLDSLEIDA